MKGANPLPVNPSGNAVEAQAQLPAVELELKPQVGGPILLFLARACAVLVILTATIVLAGWTVDVEPLFRPFPGTVATNPMTALLLGAGGVALCRLTCFRGAASDLWAGLLAAALTVAGALKLADYTLGLGFHIDHWLFAAKTYGAGVYPPAEMAPNAAVAFIFYGVALLLLNFNSRRTVRPAQVLTLWTGLIAFVALTGYGYHVLLLYRVAGAIPMAFQTALCFALLCVGSLAARPTTGLMVLVTSRTTGGAIVRRLLPMAILVPWLLGAFLLMGEHGGILEREFGLSIFAVSSAVIFTGLIWWNARLLYSADLAQMQNERRLAAQHNAVRVLAQAGSVDQVWPELLQVIAEPLDWKVGVFWKRDRERSHLRAEELWRAADQGLEDFAAATRTLVLRKGEDLPGRVWSSAQPVWLEDNARAFEFPRAELALSSGLRAACAFPVWLGREFFGVLEFFMGESRSPDPALQEMLTAVATQAGLFVERMHAEEQLRHMTANLQRSNTDLQQFAYVASHDLIEPLRMITSYLQLLGHRYEEKLDAQGREFIGAAVDGARRMEALIRDLLAYSRVDIRGGAFEPVDLEHVLQAATANLKVAIEESGATIEHGPLPRVRGDSIQLTQLLQNLVGNALKFRGQAPPRVHLWAERQEHEWLFRVKDNGIGIDPKHFERIFVLFQRLHTRQEYVGTGIGLAICKKIVERHGGRIGVESKPGEGATFWFTLPVIEGQ